MIKLEVVLGQGEWFTEIMHAGGRALGCSYLYPVLPFLLKVLFNSLPRSYLQNLYYNLELGCLVVFRLEGGELGAGGMCLLPGGLSWLRLALLCLSLPG